MQEVSLLADLRAVVARALSGLDMFSEADGKLSPTVSSGMATPFSPQPSGDMIGAAIMAGSGVVPVVPRKATMREGVFTGLNSLMAPRSTGEPHRHSSTGGAITPAVEHKIETLVAAPAAVEEALASLIVDNQDKYHALQYRALVTYVKRVYHPFLMCEPQVNQHGSMLTAIWMFHEPRTAQTELRRQTMGAFLVLPSLKDLHKGLHIVGQSLGELARQAGVDPSGSVLHIAVCNGNDALAVSEGAGQLLAGGSALLGCDAEEFSNVQLIGCDGLNSAANPKQITQVVAAAIKDATPTLHGMKVGTISVLAAAALMPVRNGFVWDDADKMFRFEPCLRQVRGQCKSSTEREQG